MKKVLRFLTLAAMLCIPWVTQAQAPTLNEGFESTTFPPTDWTVINVSGSSNWARNTSYAHEGTAAAYINYNYSGAENYLITPKLVPAVGEELSFYIKQTNASWSGTTITIEVSTTTATASAFTTVLDTYVSGSGGDLTTTYAEKTIDLSAYVGQEIYLAFHVVDDNGNNICIDDVTGVTLFVPSCPQPTGLAATLTPGSGTIATLNWTAGGTETDWVVEYSTASDFTGAASVNVSGTPTANLTGLTAETQYYARVKADCGGGDVSDWSTTCTFTPSNAYTITVNDDDNTNTYVPIHGSYCDYGNRSQFIIPASEISAMQYGAINELTFFVNANITATFSGTVFNIYMTEVNYTEFPTTDFVDWASMEEVYSGSLTWSGTEWVFTLDNPYVYNGENLLIGFVETAYTSSYTTINWLGENQSGNTALSQYASSSHAYSSDQGTARTFLPKITFSYTPGTAPSCPKPTALTASSVSDNGATLSWTGGSESQWVLQYGTNNTFDPSTYTEENVSTDPQFVIPSGLNGNTQYYFRVKADCGGGDESDWASLSFTTLCSTITVDDAHPYTVDMRSDEIADCWAESDGSYHWDFSSSDGATFTSSSYSLQTSNKLISPVFDFGAGDNWLSFTGYLEGDDWYGDEYTASLKVYYRTSPSGAWQELTGQSYSVTGDNDLDLDVSAVLLPANTCQLAFEATSDYYDYANAYLYDFTVEKAPACLPVTNLAVGVVTATTVELTWTDNNGGTPSWVVTDGSDNPVYVTGLSSTGCTVTGLTANTAYTFKVKADCGGGSYSSVESISATTRCEAVTITLVNPLTEGFEGYTGTTYSATDGVVPDCWDSYTTGTVAPHIIGSGSYYFVHDGSKALTFYGNGNCYAALPEFTNAISTLQISFWMQTESASNGALTLGYITASDVNFNTFTEIETYTNNNGSMVQRTTELDNVPAEAARLVFRWYYSGQWSCCIDDVKVSLLRPCKAPTALACTDYTATTATFSWTPNGVNQTAWQLYISSSNSAPADDIDGNLVINANTNPFTVTSGLVAEHTYYAWVRGNCSSDGYSEWSDAIEFMPSQYKNYTYQPTASSNSSSLPIYGYYANNATNKGQILIPASNIPVEMGDATVRRLTFYTTSYYANVDWGAAEFDVLVAEVDATSFESSAFFDWNDMTTVYSGSLSVINQEMVIDLDAPFTYTGGNLLIGFDLTTTGTSASVSWVATYGSTNLGAYQYGSYGPYTSTYQPKITFNYLPSATPRPTNVHPTEELSTEATLVWTAPYGGNPTGYEYQYKIATEEVWYAAATTAGLNVTLTGLTPEKTYDFRVRAVYAGPAYSQYATTQFTTPASCPIPDGLAASNLTMNTADLEWNAFVEVANYTVQYRTAATEDALFKEDFEDEATFAHWTFTSMNTANDIASGKAGRLTDAKHNGTYGFRFSSYTSCSSEDGATYDQYLVSPELTVTGELKFYAKKYGNGDDIYVGYSTTTNDLSAFTWDADALALTTSWAEYTHDLPADVKYIAFHYYGNCKYYAYIDDITIGAFDIPAGSWNTATATAPNTGEYQLTGLTAGTKYDVRVYAECAADPETENDMITITTLANGNKVFTNASSDGLWNTAANWVPEGAPAITDNAIIRANATIPNGTVATAKKITFEGSPLPTLTLADGGQLISNNSANIIVQKNATANRWMGISTPSVTSYGSTNIKDGTYDLLQYNESTSTWQSQKSAYSMTKGRGYIYRRANAATLTFTGATNVGNQNSYAISYAATDASLKGFNLIGNPYPHNIYYGAAIPTTSLAVGFYTLQPNGTWQATSASTPIGVGQAILVKASAAVSPFTMTDIATAPGAKAAPAATLAFTVSNDEYSDVAYAMFSNGEGLPKIGHLNPEAPALYISMDEGRYAIATLNENTESFPMAFSGFGEYTLSLSDNNAVSDYLHLIDRATGRDIDLLVTPEYTFFANGNADRFEVRLMPGMDENGNVTFVRIDGSRLIVDGEGELQVFDVMGRQLGSAQVSGTTTLDRSSLGIVNAGVYVMRLDGNSQKIVVK